uniref:Uncharacterized protein n=1 Tax=Arundo donax TaxID=35708 RepID=A0A0A8Z6N0_ARUDO
MLSREGPPPRPLPSISVQPSLHCLN